jgi:predicted cupin superfamily sugar epimerase
MPTARDLIDFYQLKPLAVEGGLFTRTYLAGESIHRAALPGRYAADHAYGSAIMVLLTGHPDSFSALHKLPTDEIYHYYMGDPMELTLLHPDGRAETVVLGHDVLSGQRVQQVVPRGVWQGSRLLPGGRYALFGTTMAPGYHHSDYAGGERGALIARYPAMADRIRLLTRLDAPLTVDKPQEEAREATE